MKKLLLLPLLLLASGLFAQKKLNTADKNLPPIDPTQIIVWSPTDTLAPTVTCLNGLSVNIMPTGMISLWNSDFLLSVSDDVTPTDQIKLGIRKCGTGTGMPLDANGNPVLSLTFACTEIGTQCVELWARDAAGNANFCETYVVVQDNLSNCPGSGGNWLIEVCTKIESLDGLEEAFYEVTGSNPNEPFYANDVSDIFDGCGYFDVPLGSNIVATSSKDDNPLNGVTTYDKVLIAKHIEGVELLNSPYKIIAADADRNGVIDSMDILEIENLILGIYTEFPNNTSWRFVDKAYTFPDPTNPFAETFPESISVQNIQTPVSLEFVGIKVGDVNGTAVANWTGQVLEERTGSQETSTASIGLPRPNPADGASTLPIYLTKAENLWLEISDLAGKLLWANDLQLEKGNHSLEIPAAAMPAAGVYVWRVKAGDVVKAGKLVRL